MGVFGFLGKALKKVAKVGAGLLRTGASVATSGVSDAVLAEVKKAVNPGAGRVQKVAALALAPALEPRIKVTEQQEGWNFSPNAYGGSKRVRAMGKPRPMVAALMPAPKPKPKKKPKAKAAPKPPTGRTLPPALRAAAERTRALAAQWRAAGGKDGTGQPFFQWMRGR